MLDEYDNNNCWKVKIKIFKEAVSDYSKRLSKYYPMDIIEVSDNMPFVGETCGLPLN